MEQAKKGPVSRRTQSIQRPGSGQDLPCRQRDEDRDQTLDPASQVINDVGKNHLVESGTRV